MSKRVLFQTIQISTLFSSIQPISGATIPGQSGAGNDDNKGVLCFTQSFSITGASPSDCLGSYLGHSLGQSYPFAEMQLEYSKAPADWVKYIG